MKETKETREIEGKMKETREMKEMDGNENVEIPPLYFFLSG